DYHHGVRVL
nr:RecName: Full=Bacteriocin serracin-P 43 kDa subunit [Serratia plymuthica]